MKIRIANLARLLVLLLVLATSAALSAQAPWWRTTSAPAYQVLVYSYADSNGDGWGDLRGLQNRLDDIASLGVQTLWLSPINPSVWYFGYDTMDYQDIDPRWGTLEDFDQLVAAAHKRGMRILLDIAFNHTSNQHPWFQSFLKNPKSPYRDYYVWKRPGVNYGQTTMGSFQNVPGNPDLRYFAAFSDFMPDLDNSNPAVVAEEKAILRFWLERGVDGFRFDAAKEIFNAGEVAQGTATLALTKAYWNSLRNAAREVNPNVLFLGEVPTKDPLETKVYASCFDSLFDFASANLLTNYSVSGRETGLATTMEKSFKLYKGVSGFVPAPFLTNHDQDRVMSVDLAKNETSGAAGWGPAISDDQNSMAAKERALARARIQAGLSLTLPGIPFIYYGEELGMAGRRYLNDDVARRDAMKWGDSNPSGEEVTWALKSRKLEPEQNKSTPSWADQDGDPTSLLTLYRTLGNFRKNHPLLASWDYTVLSWSGLNKGTLVGYQRADTTETLVITANLGEADQTFSAPAGKTLSTLVNTASEPRIDGTTVTQPALSLTIWSLK